MAAFMIWLATPEVTAAPHESGPAHICAAFCFYHISRAGQIVLE